MRVVQITAALANHPEYGPAQQEVRLFALGEDGEVFMLSPDAYNPTWSVLPPVPDSPADLVRQQKAARLAVEQQERHDASVARGEPWCDGTEGCAACDALHAARVEA